MTVRLEIENTVCYQAERFFIIYERSIHRAGGKFG